MESLINCDSEVCRLCSHTNNLIDLLLPENEIYLKNLSSFVFVEVSIFFSIFVESYIGANHPDA